MAGLRRRDVLLAAGALLVVPMAKAQPGPKLHRIGWLGSGIPPEAGTPNVSYIAFIQGMRELGYVEGRNFVLEQRYGQGKPELTAEHAAELARLRVDVIVALSTTSAAAAIKATRVIPIVMGSAANPVAAGLVASLSRPGGNLTGLTLETADTTAKRLELLKQAVPHVRRVAALHPAELRSFPVIADWLKANENAASQLGVTLVPIDLPIKDLTRWDEIFAATAASGLNAATVLETPTYLAYRAKLVELALKHGVAAIFPFREQAEAGGLMAYGADVSDLYRRAAGFVDKVLKGKPPGELPVEQPTRFTFVVNLRTATALGLAIPPPLLLRADRVIQ